MTKRTTKVGIGEKLWKSHLLKFTLSGVSPLLQHNPAGMKRSGGGIKTKSIPSAEVEAEAGTYRLPDKTLGVHALAVRSSIISGASGLKVQGTRMGASTILAGALEFVTDGDELFPLYDDDNKPISTYKIDERRVVIGKSGVIRARPRIDPPWNVDCILKLTLSAGDDPKSLIENTLVQVIGNAGQRIGIMDGRPETNSKHKGLWFGKFRLTNISAEDMLVK